MPIPKIKRGVTLYSYQEEFYTRTMTLADCMAELESMDCQGVELLPEQMAPNFPNLPESWVDEWNRLVEKHHLKQACMDCFVDNTCGGHRQMGMQECAELLDNYMKVAKRLGFDTIRPTTGPVEEGAVAMMLAALPYAEMNDVKIAVEIHAPLRLRSKFIDDYLEMLAKTGTKHFGFTLDLGIFCRQTPDVLLQQAKRKGVTPEIFEYVMKAYRERRNNAWEVGDEVDTMSDKRYDRFFARMAFGFGPPDNDPKDIALIAPYIFNVHGKFYEMNDQLEETTIPYPAVIQSLIDNNVEAYVNSEYEGQRFIQDAFEVDSCEQIRRHQLMMKRLIGA